MKNNNLFVINKHLAYKQALLARKFRNLAGTVPSRETKLIELSRLHSRKALAFIKFAYSVGV